MRREYPLVPKSTRRLLPGDFWAIPMKDGTYACGRVIELAQPSSSGARTCFLGGLLNWRASTEPTAEAIAKVAVLEQGVMHIKAITSTGGAILGNRPLALDNIESWLFSDGGRAQRGLTPVMLGGNEVLSSHPVLRTWGYNVIRLLAERHLLREASQAAEQ